MVASHPDILVPRHGDQGLVWGILISALLHGGAIAAGVLLSREWLPASPGAVSYTVELVASAEPAGTNLIPGGGKSQSPPAAAPPKVEPAPVLKSEPTGPQEAPPEKLAEPPPVEPPAPKVEEKPKPEPPPPVKAEEKPNPEPPPPPRVEKQQPEPKAEAKPVEKLATKPDAVVAKKAPEKPEKKVAEKPAAPEKSAEVQKKPAPSPVVAAAEQPKPPPAAANSKETTASTTKKAKAEPSAVDKQIAAAVERRKQEQQIAAAVERRAKVLQEGSGAGTGRGAEQGAPVSLGQGTGSGGVVEGLEMILYRGQLERRIKENWVWSGEDSSLEVRVLFEITETGQVVNVRTVSSSGNPSYDASAERAIRSASPLPAPPEKYRSLFVHGVELTFRAQDLRS